MEKGRSKHSISDKQYAFCVAVAAGRSMAAAFRETHASRGTPTTCSKRGSELMKRPEIAETVQRIRDRATEVVAAKVAANVDVTRDYVLSRLKEIVERCMQNAQILTRHGKPVMVETAGGERVPAYTFNARDANRALELLGREIGMFVERKEVRTGPLVSLADHELDAELATLTAEVAQLTGKPIAEVLKQSMRAELAIDVTPTERANPRSPPALALVADAEATQGGVLEPAAEGPQ
jgi:Lhr-like helicase